MKQFLHLAFFLFCLSWTTNSHAQKIILTGKVIDDDTEEGLAFSNIFIDGTTKGVVCDETGSFTLEIDRAEGDSLVANSMGYYDQKKFIRKEQTEQNFVFRMKETSYSFTSFEVEAGENPANEIQRRIVKNKRKNDRSALPAYEVEMYSKVELDIDNIDPSMKERGIFKKAQFIFDNVDSTSDVKPFLPAYVAERMYDVYHVKAQGSPKEALKAQKVSGVTNQSVVDFINSMYEKYNVYDNWIEILGKSFVSPFSNQGLTYYEYYILDSTTIKGKWSYKLKFKPKRRQENTFYGDFWVAMDDYSVQILNMRMSPDVNINLVDRLIIYIEFDLMQDSLWLPVKEKMVIDFSSNQKDKGLGVIGRTTVSYKDYRINDPNTAAKHKKYDPEDIDLDNITKADTFWQQNRHEALTKNEEAVYKMIDTIQTIPVFKTYADLITLLGSGYKVFGQLEVGPYWDMFYLNAVDGLRIGLGLGTSVNFSNRLRIYGYAGYGLRDKRWKYRGLFQYVFNKQRRTEIMAYYHYDATFETRNTESLPTQSLLAGLLRRDAPQKMLYSREAKIYYQHGFKKGFSTRLALVHRNLDPIGYPTLQAGGFNFKYQPDLNDANRFDTSFTTFEAVLRLRFAFKEKLLKANFSQISLGSKYPIVALQYTAGIKGVLGSRYDYHALRLNVHHWFYTNPIGWVSYDFEAGTILGRQIPYLFLETSPGNEGYFYNEQSFNSMNNYEFVSDQYVSLRVEHHWDGFLLNRIPLIRKLKWREVIAARAVWGSLRNQNYQANRFNHYDRQFTSHRDAGRSLTEGPFYGTFDRGPYWELSAGIENIFKFFRVDALWRMNYLDNRDVQKFSVRVTLDFNF